MLNIHLTVDNYLKSTIGLSNLPNKVIQMGFGYHQTNSDFSGVTLNKPLGQPDANGNYNIQCTLNEVTGGNNSNIVYWYGLGPALTDPNQPGLDNFNSVVGAYQKWTPEPFNNLTVAYFGAPYPTTCLFPSCIYTLNPNGNSNLYLTARAELGLYTNTPNTVVLYMDETKSTPNYTTPAGQSTTNNQSSTTNNQSTPTSTLQFTSQPSSSSNSNWIWFILLIIIILIIIYYLYQSKRIKF